MTLSLTMTNRCYWTLMLPHHSLVDMMDKQIGLVMAEIKIQAHIEINKSEFPRIGTREVNLEHRTRWRRGRNV